MFLKSRYLLWFFSIFLLTSQGSQAAPLVVQEAFEAKYPKVSGEEWEVDDNGLWEAQFSKNGKNYRADFREDGTWVETEESIEFDDLPEAVRNSIRSEFKDRHIEDIAEIEAVDNAVSGRFYDVEFVLNGDRQDIEYKEDGRRVEVMDKVVKTLTEPIGDFGQKPRGAADMGRLELVIEFGFNVLWIFIFAYLIYYRRHHDHQMLFLLFGFNLFLFPIFLLSATLTAGFGFTIFALLALVRLRSDTFSKTEVAYLLGAVALTFINAMFPARVETVSSLVVLATAWLADHPNIWRDAYQKARIRYPMDDTENMLNLEFLSERIAEDYQVEVNDIQIERVQKNQVRLLVMYRDLPEIRNKRKMNRKGWKRNKESL